MSRIGRLLCWFGIHDGEKPRYEDRLEQCLVYLFTRKERRVCRRCKKEYLTEKL